MDISALIPMKNAENSESHCEGRTPLVIKFSNPPGARKGMLASMFLLLLAASAVLSLRGKAGVPEVKQEYPLDLSILQIGRKETYKDHLSNCEWAGTSLG